MTWSYSYNPEIWPAIVTLGLTIFLGAYSWQRRYIPAAKPFTFACAFGGLWTFGVIMELSALDYPDQIVWMKFQAIWQLPAATTITCFALRYAGLGRWLTMRNYVLLSLVPLLCALLMITNDFHYLIWTGFRINEHVTGSPGRFFWAFISYGILLGIVNFFVLIWLAISSPRHRSPVAIMLVGQLIGRLGYTLDKLDADLIGPGESVFIVVGIASAAYAFAFLRFHTIDPIMAARQAVLQQMNEGLFVLDLQGCIIDVNPMAEAILGISQGILRGKPLTSVMPINSDSLKELGKKGIRLTEIPLTRNKSAKQYNLNMTELRGRHNEVIGQLLLLHDVTEQKKAQTKILEQQRVMATLQERDRLARELHDGIGQILGYVSMQVQTAIKWARDGSQARAESLLARVMEVSKDAHADVRESILSLRTGSDSNWSLIPAIKKYVDRFQINYNIQIELVISDRIEENTLAPSTEVQLWRVIQEAMTNCRKHSGAQILKIDMGLDGNKVTVSISDDGHGFDTKQLGRGDCEHFGLVFMRERMEQIGGSLQMDSIPEGGTVIRLDAPIRKQLEESK